MSRRKNKKQNMSTKPTHIIDLGTSSSAETDSPVPPALSVSRPRAVSAPEPAEPAEKAADVHEEVPAMQPSDEADDGGGESLIVEQADVAIKRGGEKFYDYYAQYRNLRDIARAINGLPQSAPFPRQLSIQKITIDFTLDGEAKTAESAEPKKVGDIAPLISFAIRDVIEKMNNELHVLSYLVTGMRNSVQTAFNSRAMAPPPGNYDNTNTQQ